MKGCASCPLRPPLPRRAFGGLPSIAPFSNFPSPGSAFPVH